MVEVRAMLVKAVEAGASDVHLNVTMPPIMRINTQLVVMDFPAMEDKDIRQMLLDMVGAEKCTKFDAERDLDFSTKIPDGTRFRVNARFQRDSAAISFRVIPSNIPTIEELNLPPIINDFVDLPRGLVLVTGPTGSGKSTTLASMINAINKKYKKRIITLEDPIEYALENDQCMIEQREIGSDCRNFALGLRHVLRQDPDIILVGEMRDLETTSASITAAETGHLVFSTLHTINAAQTVERIIDMYPGDQQNQIRSMLANTLQAVISQTLFKRIDQLGMVPCTEMLICNAAVRNCIREARIFEIPNIIETSRQMGMQSLDFSIAEMYFNGHIGREDAINHSSNPSKMEKKLTDEGKVSAGKSKSSSKTMIGKVE